MKKRTWAAVAVGLVVLAVASTGFAEEVLRCGVWQPHQQFNPFFKGTGNEVLEGIWERLLDVDLATGEITGELAESFELDGDILRVKLHEGVYFHDGKELTAQIVADCIEMCRDAGLGRNMSYPVSLIEAATVTGTYTLDIEFIDTVGPRYALEVLTYLVIGDPSMAPFDSVNKANGTGPFKVESERPGAELVLVKNDNWWQGEATLDKIIFTYYASDITMMEAFRSGEEDVAWNVPFQLMAEFDADPAVELVEHPLGPIDYLILPPTGHPAFANKLVRQAFQYALDRGSIVEVGYFGYSKPKQMHYDIQSPYYVPELDHTYYYDLDKAKQLITEAGYPDGFEFDLIVRHAHLFPVAELLQEDLAKIGVTMNIQIVDKVVYKDLMTLPDAFYQAAFKGFQYFPEWTIPPQFPFRTEWWGFVGGTAPFAYTDAIQDTEAATTAEATRSSHIRRQLALLDESWIVFFATRPQVMALHDYVDGMYFDTFNWPEWHETVLNK